MDSHITWFSTASSGKCLGMECLQKLLGDKYESSVRWQGRRMCIHLLLRELQNYNSLLNNRQLENVGCHQKKILHIQGQRKTHSKIIGGAKSFLESNPIPSRDARRAQTKSCVH